MKPQTTERPYHLTFDYSASGTYLLSSMEAQRLIDAYPVVKATRNKVTLRSDQPDGMLAILLPATLGGGDAFVIGGRR